METLKSSGYAPVNGLAMYYEVHGAGSIPLVLIHGGGSTLDSTFGTLIPLLSTFAQVIAVELQAHGRTNDRDTPESFEQDADDVAALVKHLKIGKADFLGYSNGGTTALQIAIRHPQLVHQMVVVSANYQREGLIDGFFEGMQYAALDNMPAILKDAFLKVTPDESRLQNMFNKDKERMLNFTNIPDEDIQAINVPTLLMVAQHDVVTVDHVLKMSNLIAGAQLVVLPGFHGSFIGAAESGVEAGDKLVGITAGLVEGFLKGATGSRDE